jgi:hypothetical protein
MIQVLEEVDLKLWFISIGGLAIKLNLSYHDNPQFAFRQIPKPDLLDSHRLAGAPVDRSVHAPKSSLAQTVTELVSLQAFHLRGRPLCSPIFARTPLRQPVPPRRKFCLDRSPISLAPAGQLVGAV